MCGRVRDTERGGRYGVELWRKAEDLASSVV